MCAIQRHTFLNLGKREQRGSKRLVKQSYRPLSTPERFFFALFLSFSPACSRHPRIFLCALSPPVRPHPRHESCTHDAMANGEWITHAPDMIFFLLSWYPHPIPPLVRRGVAWWLGVRVGEVRVLLRATLTSSMSVVR